MSRRLLIIGMVAGCALVLTAYADVPSRSKGIAPIQSTDFGTCAYWTARRTGRDSANNELYLIGLTHGFALGLSAGPHSYVTGATNVVSGRFLDMYSRGHETLLRRPAVLMDAFDTKCCDYRNERIDLTDIGYVVVLELGGARALQVERALEILRGHPAKTSTEVVQRRRAVQQAFLSKSIP